MYLALLVPFTLFIGFAYAACESWWRKRHPAQSPAPTRSAIRRAQTEAILTAETVVHDAYAGRYAALYVEESLRRLPTP